MNRLDEILKDIRHCTSIVALEKLYAKYAWELSEPDFGTFRYAIETRVSELKNERKNKGT